MPSHHRNNGRIIQAFCCGIGFQPIKRMKCVRCEKSVKPGATVVYETKTGGHLYGCYRPPRPATMTPVRYYQKYHCVDAQFTRVTNGRYYCNPAHCKNSWKSKEHRDAHLSCAYGALI